MDVTKAVQTQRTIRAFKPQAVPEVTIREVIELAKLAPSNGNTQPWHIVVVSGDAKEQLKAAIRKEIEEGIKPYPVFPPGGSGLKGVYKDRQRACGFKYYASMDVDRADGPGREALMMRNYDFFGAPHAAFLSYPGTMNRANAIDMGIFLQNLLLLFVERGIQGCPQGALATYPGPVKELLPIPEENAILCGLSFGYPDYDAQINSAKMTREPFENFADIVSTLTT
jgi:nitroreductase